MKIPAATNSLRRLRMAHGVDPATFRKLLLSPKGVCGITLPARWPRQSNASSRPRRWTQLDQKLDVDYSLARIINARQSVENWLAFDR
jgi:hypothetical protein